MDLFASEYLPFIAVAVLIGAILGFLLFRPRQKVRLSDSMPVRPHMVSKAEATDLGAAPQQDHPLTGSGNATGADDFQRMKGVGPKLAQILHARGLVRFQDLAALSAQELSDLDDDLGAFKGRLTRDRVPDQARLLAAGDIAGFEREFGKLQNR